MKTKTFEEMLDLICQNVNTSSPDKAVYTLLLGAGFSYGVIPTAKEILISAPEWLYSRSNKQADKDKDVNKIEVAKNFWAQIKKTANSKLEFDDNTGLPKDSCISEAYKFLMSADCSGGLTNPMLRREYIRNLCNSAVRKNNPAHLYLACLLNQQLKTTKWGSRAKFCKTILTTNFDPLLQDALQLVNVLYYMSDQPQVLDYLQEDSHNAIHLVYTHGSVHRYILLNSEDEIKTWKQNSSSLKSHFEQHGVIVIGYGGWDDATMKALQEANRFDGNLYWCVRKQDADTLSEEVQALLERHSSYAFKVIIPDADEAMNKIFERLTGLQTPEFMTDPINMILEQMDGLSFTIPVDADCSGEVIGKRDFSDNFNSQIQNSIKRLKVARAIYINPEKYSTDDQKPPKLNGVAADALDMQAQAIASKYLVEASRLTKANELIPAIEMWSKVLKIPGIPVDQKANALIGRARTYRKLKPMKIEEAIADYTAVIKMKPLPIEDRAMALFNRAIAFSNLVPPKTANSIADCTAVIEMPHVPIEYKARALCHRACAYGKAYPRNFNQAIMYYTAVIEEPGTFSGCKATALNNRANKFSKMVPPKIEEAIVDCTTVLGMPDIPAQCKAVALNIRAYGYAELTPPKTKEAIADCTTVIEMPDAPVEDRARALINRAIRYSEIDPPKIEEAIADCTTVIEMPDAPAEDRAMALINRAIGYSEIDPAKTKEAIADYSAAISMDLSNEFKSSAHCNFGLLCFKKFNNVQKFLSEMEKAISLDNDSYVLRYNIGLAMLFLGKPEEALRNCLPALKESSTLSQLQGALNLLREKASILPKKSASAYDKIINELEKRKASLE